MASEGGYILIPMFIATDNELSMTEKVMYGMIHKKINDNTGHCWASNKWFSDNMGISKDTVSRCISNLQKCGYISVFVIRNTETKQIEKRIIKIIDYRLPKNPVIDDESDENNENVSNKCSEGDGSFEGEGIGKIRKENNPNIIKQNSDEFCESKNSKTLIQKFQELHVEKYGRPSDISWGKDSKLITDKIKIHGYDNMELLLKAFFDTEDWFTSVRTIGKFVSSINYLYPAIDKAKEVEEYLKRINGGANDKG